jgi:uncharacterized protein YxeA
MKKIIYILLFLILTTQVFASDFDFRQINWGMNQQQVIQSEKAKLLNQDEKHLIYECQVNNKDCALIYEFYDNKIVCTTYFFQINHINLNNYIDDYIELHNLLKNKYQEPIENKIIWKNNLFKNSPLDYGTAISIGHLVYFSKWETETTKIGLNLLGDNYTIQLILMYVDKNYVPESPATDDL